MSEGFGTKQPSVKTPVPGPDAKLRVDGLARTECPSLTMRRERRGEEAGGDFDPIVWERAKGINVQDTDGNVFVDMISGFGVATLGHAYPPAVRAIQEQSQYLVHGLGDVHPSVPKLALLDKLGALSPWKDTRIILGNGGSDAVEAALKTATLHTGRPGVIAFDGGYHGLSLGASALCGYSERFRMPFAQLQGKHVSFAPYPNNDEAHTWSRLDAIAGAEPIGAVIIEPVLGRGGVRVPPDGFLERLGTWCREQGALLIVDEILTGLGRTGSTFESVAQGATADLVCVGKALGGGLPLSACLGRADVMAAWGNPDQEALHTGTFFGNPLACAAALAILPDLTSPETHKRTERVSNRFRKDLERIVGANGVHGRGFLLAIDPLGATGGALGVVHRLLQRGYITLPCGGVATDARLMVQLLPCINTPEERLSEFVRVLEQAL